LCLSDDLRSQLDELMMEALLLQVSLPEMQHIYQILWIAQYPVVEGHQQRSELLNCEPVEVMQCIAETCSSTAEGEGCCLKPMKREGNCEKKKRRLEKDGSVGEKREKCKKLNNPKKRNLKFNQEKSKDLSLVRIEAEKYLECLQPHEALAVIMEPPCSEPEDSEDEDAICPAENCQQPEGDE
ncbi:hypothetical protein scyTo_0021943, partial [Scyliorhinus torazame]|nr:hypothetical protein [Scyliorhinus torazame]